MGGIKKTIPSPQSKTFTALLGMISKMRLSRKFVAGNLARLNCPEPPLKFQKHCHITKKQLNGRNVFTLKPVHVLKSQRHILYLHGGAYTYSFFKFHWKFL